jgi:hypothetical protein
MHVDQAVLASEPTAGGTPAGGEVAGKGSKRQADNPEAVVAKDEMEADSKLAGNEEQLGKETSGAEVEPQPKAKKRPRAMEKILGSADVLQQKIVAEAKPQFPYVGTASDAVMQGKIVELRKLKWRRNGVRWDPEPPRLISKLVEAPGQGELWLGAMPTADTLMPIIDLNMSIQVICFKDDPNCKYRDEAKRTGQGEFIPECISFKLEMSNPSVRARHLATLMPILGSSLMAGDNAYIHCMTGLCRGAMAAGILTAALERIPLGVALRRVDTLRGVTIGKAAQSMGGRWAEQGALAEISLFTPPELFAICSHSRLPRAHAVVVKRSALVALCKLRKGGTEEELRSAVTVFGDLKEARKACQFFCLDCVKKMIASAQLEVERIFDTWEQ